MNEGLQSFYRSITNSISENVKFQYWNIQMPIAWKHILCEIRPVVQFFSLVNGHKFGTDP